MVGLRLLACYQEHSTGAEALGSHVADRMCCAGKGESDTVCEGALQWCVKGLGWTLLCIHTHHLTRWLVRSASTETAHVDLQLFLLQRPPYLQLSLFLCLHQKLKALPCPFPTVCLPTALLTLVCRDGSGGHCYTSPPWAQSQFRRTMCIYWDWVVEEFWASKIIIFLPFLDKILGQKIQQYGSLLQKCNQCLYL